MQNEREDEKQHADDTDDKPSCQSLFNKKKYIFLNARARFALVIPAALTACLLHVYYMFTTCLLHVYYTLAASWLGRTHTGLTVYIDVALWL